MMNLNPDNIERPSLIVDQFLNSKRDLSNNRR